MRAAKKPRSEMELGDLPLDALTGCARVTVMGRGALLVEGQSGVVELGAERIRLKTRDGVLTICGIGLALRELSLDAAKICAQRFEAVFYGEAP